MLAYAPYRRTGTLGLGAVASVPVTAGWHTPKRELISEFTTDQKRAPTVGEISILQRLAERSNAVLRRMTGGHSPSRTDEMDFNTAQGLINFYLVKGRGPDHLDPVAPPRGGPETEFIVTTAVHAVPDKKSIFSSIVDVITAPAEFIVHAAEKIPVLGDVVKIADEAATAPLRMANSIASGARLDHVALGALKDQLKIAKDVAPYAATVVSLVPGIGSGAAAAIGMGAALAEGRSITQAVKDGIRNAIPGGTLVQAGFDTALKVASGENVGKIALEEVRTQLSPAAQKAFDIGVAVATGEKIQTALAKGLASIAPGQMQTILAAGEHAVSTVPGLSDALKSVAPGGATQGFKLAAGLLGQAGIGEKALTSARNALAADVRQGFDAALKTQESHIPWLANVTSPTAAAAPATPAPAPLEPPKHAAAPAPAKPPAAPLEPPKKAVASHYAPYPKMGALSGPPPDCHSLGAPITNMPHGMRQAGLSAVSGTGGRPRMVHGPDGNDYLFSLESGTLSARQCFSGGTLSQEWTVVSGARSA